MRKINQDDGAMGAQKRGSSYTGHEHTGKLHRGVMHAHSVPGKDKCAGKGSYGDDCGHGSIAHGFNPPEEYSGHAGQGGGAPSMDSNESSSY